MGWDAFGNLYVSTGNNKNNGGNFSATDERTIINDNQQGTANTTIGAARSIALPKDLGPCRAPGPVPDRRPVAAEKTCVAGPRPILLRISGGPVGAR